MPNHRYHVHVACIDTDPLLSLVQDDVAIFFEGRAFLTWDLKVTRAESASYAWRCMNQADMAVVLVGSMYGSLNAQGVSQLHVSYNNAKTKHKPVIILIHKDAYHSGEPKLLDFINVIKAGSHLVWEFDDRTSISEILTNACQHADLDRTQGWVALGESHRQKLIKIPLTTKERTGTFYKKEEEIDVVLNGIAPSEKVVLADIDVVMDTPPKNTTKESSLPSKSTISLDGEFAISCTAHAFKGGTLIDVAFTMAITWRPIITMLDEISAVFSEQAFGRALSELINKDEAGKIVSFQYPEVHAISRLQVVREDVLWILSELKSSGWVEANGSGMWQLGQKTHEINL